MGHRDANAHLGIYTATRVPENWVQTSGLDWSSNEATKASLAAYFTGWSEELLQLIHKSSANGEKIAPRPIYALPVGHGWEHRSGVTLIGDARSPDVSLRWRWSKSRHARRSRSGPRHSKR